MAVPIISAVMPHFNQSHLVSNAVMSILNQTIQDWELIIVDDGSEQNHWNKLRYALEQFNDSRIKMYSFEFNHGLVEARTYGNQLSQTEIIAVQDADDLSLPDRFEKCLKAIEDADVVIHGAYINMWDTKFNCITRKYLPPGNPDKKEILKGQNLTGWPIFRKNVWKEKPYRKETEYMYDWSCHLDWLFSGYTYKAINEGLYEYVRHENSASITFEKDGRRAKSREQIKTIMKKEYGQTIL